MGIIWFLIVGFFAGLIARALMPGKQPMGLLKTTALGVCGSLLGGFVASLISRTQPVGIHSSGILGSIVGAFALLALLGGFERWRHHHHAPL
jgi:uncharacterized membrane protein YeaQ/YmgE (transglycosylase-associated protein family)